MKTTLRSFFLTRRFFGIGWAIVGLFVAAYFLAPLLPVAMAAVALLLVATVLDAVRLYGVKEGIQASRHTLAKWSNGDENPVTITVLSRYRIPIAAKVLDELPAQLQERGLVLEAAIDAGGSARLSYMVRPLTRGMHAFGAINVLACTNLGLAERRYKQEQGREIAVYPSYIHLRKYELMAEADPFSAAGVRKVRRSAQRSEFEQIREYIPGDDRRTVNWKATARRAKLMVNQYQDEKAQQIVSLIDTGRTMKMPFGGLTLLDRAINATLVLSDIALKKDDKAGVITYSNAVHAVLPPARDKGWMHRVMELLYALRTDFAETDMEALYAKVKRTVPQRSLLVVYTNFESVQAMRRQLPFLQLLSRAHLVAVVIFRNTEMDALLQYPDRSTMSVYIKTITTQFIHEKELIAKELERHGVLTILTAPEQLSTSVLNKYLEVKARGML
ncbi:MAG: DUF58 domain-containing protein [Bacteroidetes bacterium]|nr:DUF58 domain-containing protein [Bacteroidota bacterium]MBS1942887.1 DUF58 domain-containing protein [Bacteroidota bacterium]